MKEFDGQRYVELYIPARTAIVLKETKDTPVEAPKKPAARRSTKKSADAAETPKKTTRTRKAKKAEE